MTVQLLLISHVSGKWTLISCLNWDESCSTWTMHDYFYIQILYVVLLSKIKT